MGKIEIFLTSVYFNLFIGDGVRIFIIDITPLPMRKCNVCKIKKPLSNFLKDKTRSLGYSYRCKICSSQIHKEKYYDKSLLTRKGKYNDYYKQRHQNKTPEQRQQQREYLREWNKKEENKQKRNKYQREVYRKRPQNIIINHLRKRINDFIKGTTKKQKYLDILGCSSEEYKLYLEKLFDENMTWENYGTYWEIDHIIPLSLFNMEDWVEVKKSFHFTNTQPLSVIENRKKSNKPPTL
jgi:hypothetical protein